MLRHWRKGALAFVAFAMVVFAASSAMALILEARSEEMLANSTCDEAGTITIFFTEEDITRINEHLVDNNYTSIRVTLGGDNVALDATPPILCKNIIGDNSVLGSQLKPLPNSDPIPGDGNPQGLVELDELLGAGQGIEVSDKDNDNVPDIAAWVYGRSGDQFFTIYITNEYAAVNGSAVFVRPAFSYIPDPDAEQAQLPWIKVGLHEDVIPPTYESTSICADIRDFGTLALLDVSLDTEPTNLTLNTSDNQIGHMLSGDMELRDCNEKTNEFCYLGGIPISSTKEIVLKPIDEQGACMTYYKCIVAEGTYPSSGAMKLIVRTNGASNGADTQKGVYLRDIELYDEQASPLLSTGFEFFLADGETEVWPDADTQVDRTAALECTYRAQYAETEIQAGNLNGDEIRICVWYQVNSEEAEVDTTVQIWVDITTIPCGVLLQDSIDAALLVKAAQRCIYFPYVLTGISNLGWGTGVAITNLSPDVAVEDMEVTATLTDNTGTAFTGTIPEDMVTGTVFAFGIDNLVEMMGWEDVAAGAAWLEVNGNFAIDGYSFVSDGNFGAGTLPRLECIDEE